MKGYFMIDYNIMPDFSARNLIIGEICKSYDFIHHYYAGESLCKRGIDVLQIGCTENSVIFCGGFHGSEYLTVLALLKFAEECASAFLSKSGSLCNALKNRGVVIVPCVNPDGVETAIHGSIGAMSYKELVESVCTDTTHWQANARGVDINHNFDAQWNTLREKETALGINSASPTRFGGNYPHSEPETKAMVRLCKNTTFDFAVALHSQGREIYYDFGKSTPPLCLSLAKRLAKVSGYKIAQPESIATGGGFKDWVIDKLKKPALTIEMGLGKNPLPISDFLPEYELVRKILTEGTFFGL